MAYQAATTAYATHQKRSGGSISTRVANSGAKASAYHALRDGVAILWRRRLASSSENIGGGLASEKYRGDVSIGIRRQHRVVIEDSNQAASAAA